jgi:hypothetical protein
MDFKAPICPVAVSDTYQLQRRSALGRAGDAAAHSRNPSFLGLEAVSNGAFNIACFLLI